jgi:iron complex outermembrane receptor protein
MPTGKSHIIKIRLDNYHQQHYQLLWNQILSEHLNLNVALHYTHGNGYYEQYKDGWGHVGEKLYKYLLTSSLGSKSDLIRRKMMDNDFYGTVFSLNYQNDKLNASFGGGWNKYTGNHTGKVIWVRNFSGNLDPNHEYYNNDATKRDGNIYGKVSYELLKGFSAYADLQYRHVGYKMDGPSDAFDDNKKQISYNINNSFDFFNPKVGLYWNVNSHHALYASFAVAHKEPTRNDYEDNLTNIPQSERLLDWELGYRYSSSIISASANLYYMKYNNQFVLTGEKNPIGELIAKNVGSSYRTGLELSLSVKPSPTSPFRWDGNLTLSRNRAKDWTVQLDDTGETKSLGHTPLSFSPDAIFNYAFSYNKKGWNVSLMGQSIGKQYMTNTGFKSFTQNGKDVSLMLDAYSVVNLNIDYTFKLPHFKSITLGATVYNLFSEKYESNGAASTQFKSDGKNGVIAYQDDYEDSYSVYSAQAPVNFLAHISLLF